MKILVPCIMAYFFTIEATVICNECDISSVKREDNSASFGFTSVIIRSKKKIKQIQLEQESKEVNIIPDKQSSFYNEPWRNVKIPMPLLLNERIRNPKFISRNPKRNKIQAVINSVKPINHPLKTKTKRRKNNKKKNGVRNNHANILNTNFKFAYLARIKNKSNAVTNQNMQLVQHNKNKLKQDIKTAKPLDVRQGLVKGRRKRVLRRKMKN